MKCQEIKEDVYLWLDGELSGNRKAELETHIKICVSCRKEAEAIETLNRALLGTAHEIKPSPGFEASFWNEASSRVQGPWFIKWLHDFEFSLPTPGWAQGLAVLVIALVVGGTGGAVSAMNSAQVSLEAKGASVRYLSGFREFKGVPAPSVAATYLKTIDERKNA